MAVLSKQERKRLSHPPILSLSEKRLYFQIEDSLKFHISNMRIHLNKVGFLLQIGYFKASGTFYERSKFRAADIKFVADILGLKVSVKDLAQYADRTRQQHRKLILEILGYTAFSESEDFVRSLVREMVSKQMHPRNIMSAISETLRYKKIEMPSYTYLAKLMTWEFNHFENKMVELIGKSITAEQSDALDQLIAKSGEFYDRPLITRLKFVVQSTRPKKIQHGVHNFLIIKRIFQEIFPLINQLSLSAEATQYYAAWIIKAKVTQITDIIDVNKRYLYLVAFISHYYKVWQDTLTDILLKSVQQKLNKTEKDLGEIVKKRYPEQQRMTASLLSGFNENQSRIQAIKKILCNPKLNNDEKVDQISQVLPFDDENAQLTQAEKDAQQLAIEFEKYAGQQNEFDILGSLSRKLQNQVGAIVKNLDFDAHNHVADLEKAILHYQSGKDITSRSPSAFLNSQEYKAIYKDDQFNASIYKAILFCKIANAIKSGELSLKYSYRYLSMESYLMDENYWRENKDSLLQMLDLKDFENIEALLEKLRNTLDPLFFEINRQIASGKNTHIKIQGINKYSLYTPPLEKPDYESVSEIIGRERYVPILHMLSRVNGLTQFTSAFRHHKVKGAQSKPGDEVFYAGLFGIGTDMELNRLANTAKGVRYNTLSHTVNWYFNLDNLYAVNKILTDTMSKLWLSDVFKKEQRLLHTSSDAQKRCISAESLNTNYSYKYYGHKKGANLYRFIDERGILFYSSVFSSSERDAAYVIDGLLHSDSMKSDMHSTDTHGYKEIIFAIAHLIGVTFAPRIKDLDAQKLVSFEKIKTTLQKKDYTIQPSYYVRECKIEQNWDLILRFIATMKLHNHKPSTIIKRLSSYEQQNPLQSALKEFGRIIKSIFILKYIDDVQFRQVIQKQLNKGELAHKFASALSFAKDELSESLKEDQEIAAMCKLIIQNIIILWNYIELTEIIMRSDLSKREALLESISQASILTWQHVNLFGTYDFRDLGAVNDNEFTKEEVLEFRVA